jgi:small-conductance mechanosensitive channel
LPFGEADARFSGAGGKTPKEKKFMSEFQDPINHTTTGTPRWVGLAVAVLGGVSLLGLGVGWSALNHANGIEQSTQASVKQANDALAQRLAKEDDVNQALQSDLKVVTDKLNLTQGELIAARKQNKNATAAVDHKVEGLATSVKAELATKANAGDVDKLNGDVSGVKSDLDAQKNNLQMARSEMGTLIARNHDEIDQLRRMGQRDYFEFTVTRKGGNQKVGNIQVELKDTNTKKNQYTINVLADDKNFEKKNRSVNEPIFFYTGGTRQALELVVNKVTKTTASGYLSIPKAPETAAANTSGSGQ